MRPGGFTVLEAQENERGWLEVWADCDGTELFFLFPPKKVEDSSIEELIAQHFDRFEEHGHDWTTQRAPDRTKNRRGKGRPELRGRRQMRGRNHGR